MDGDLRYDKTKEQPTTADDADIFTSTEEFVPRQGKPCTLSPESSIVYEALHKFHAAFATYRFQFGDALKFFRAEIFIYFDKNGDVDDCEDIAVPLGISI